MRTSSPLPALSLSLDLFPGRWMLGTRMPRGYVLVLPRRILPRWSLAASRILVQRILSGGILPARGVGEETKKAAQKHPAHGNDGWAEGGAAFARMPPGSILYAFGPGGTHSSSRGRVTP
jgi:hypothetical protein